jgi:hypothetical protein
VAYNPKSKGAKSKPLKKGDMSDLRRKILARAVVDPAFRKRLLTKPETVFEAKLTALDRAAVERIKKMLPALDDIVTSLAGEVLCGGGGGCGGLA